MIEDLDPAWHVWSYLPSPSGSYWICQICGETRIHLEWFGRTDSGGNEMIEDLDPAVLEKLAEAAHDVWMEAKIRDGWSWAPVTDKAKKEHHCLVRYSKLSEQDKQSDRDLVSGIPEILAVAGYKIVPVEAK